MADKYQLRKVAGVSWLLDVSQEGIDYRKPLPLNETASIIWTMLTEGKDKYEIAEYLCEGDMELKNEIVNDIDDFIAQMDSAGVNYREVVK